MPGKVPDKIDAFGSQRYPVKRALCPACNVMVTVTIGTSGALKGRLIIGRHGECRVAAVRVVLPKEVQWHEAA